MQDDLVARLGRELESFVSPWEDGSRREGFIASVLPRIVATLDLLPPGTPESRLLELGAEPFAQSLCLSHVWPGRVTLANYCDTADRHGERTLVEAGGTRTRTFAYDLFNVEMDEFPYPDDTFDVVMFAEMIEHLAVNPVWALSEIHRVLKPGGHLIVTTPNALSIERVGSVLTGRRPIVVDHYNPAFGYGARHNREYASYELHALLDETGFEVESMTARDLGTIGAPERVRRAVLRMILRTFSPTSRRAHLFARARRRAVFRWQFPQVLFTEPNVYRCARHPWIEIGVNDSIQCDLGWEPLEQLQDGTWVRRVRAADVPLPGGSATLRGIAGGSRVVVQMRGADGASGSPPRVRVAVAHRDPRTRAIGEPIGLVGAAVPCDRWSDVEVPLSRPSTADEHLLVNVTVDEPGRAVVVCRIALT
jgi:SAM-dependent methyltransferase